MGKVPALERALRLLNYRLRGKAELKAALSDRRYEEKEIDEAIKQLELIGLVDDTRFARALAETRISISRRGRQAIFFELLKKGVDKDLINEVLASLDEEGELEAARSLSEARLKRWMDLEPLKRKHRLLSLLQRRGFPSQIIKHVLDENRGRL